MTAEPGWVPPGVDTSKAKLARVYDYWLGGSHNFQAGVPENPQQYWGLVGVGRREA